MISWIQRNKNSVLKWCPVVSGGELLYVKTVLFCFWWLIILIFLFSVWFICNSNPIKKAGEIILSSIFPVVITFAVLWTYTLNNIQYLYLDEVFHREVVSMAWNSNIQDGDCHITLHRVPRKIGFLNIPLVESQKCTYICFIIYDFTPCHLVSPLEAIGCKVCHIHTRAPCRAGLKLGLV